MTQWMPQSLPRPFQSLRLKMRIFQYVSIRMQIFQCVSMKTEMMTKLFLVKLHDVEVHCFRHDQREDSFEVQGSRILEDVELSCLHDC